MGRSKRTGSDACPAIPEPNGTIQRGAGNQAAVGGEPYLGQARAMPGGAGGVALQGLDVVDTQLFMVGTCLD